MQDITNFDRIATAIDYIREHFKEQPDLNEVAEKVHLSPFHFQRLFTDWAGVSPKKFLQYLSIGHAKAMLQDKGATLFDTAFETGLSGTGRLHDLFIGIEGMTPGEYKNGGEALSINYSFAESPFGEIIVASTPKGICYLAFTTDREQSLADLKTQFPHARYHQTVDLIQQNALYIFTQDWKSLSDIKLHLKGTPFQLKVWEALLNIPMGRLSTYGSISDAIGNPGASRAVGSAVGSNPVAFLIPCHRVIRSTGETGDYHWGSTRKKAIIGWEAAKTSSPEKEN
ncbi:methylated-DNA--[protein]-cysteine S-methyltransferase [Flavitalea sp. BT771]|uniref:methylated-DNA--[protein]-cysteine S-methyltransferase n=1 Tax=Flavitalea sp. BT771 TaxID=3063329 RepID=UPI0026E3FB5D|nr:methylated-DNA--[protein]-cysteine S-methyltransferase [Flavitalea sp. BT771]MDO6432321.1 methylated-DNA--[protein]-cysteine S-methyltransferase [Flavitalea sp. BT771]MDV6221231.1 methylated-DNA--[protein]-cysteine S-methyltransferase [Flavitalea sp. BT771]